MAITASNLRDASARFKSLLVFLFLGLVLGVLVGSQVEFNKLSLEEQEHATAYAAGWAMQASGLADRLNRHEPELVTVYRTIRTKFPDSADAIQRAVRRVTLAPWPIVGLLMGLGLMGMYSRFLSLNNKTE